MYIALNVIIDATVLDVRMCSDCPQNFFQRSLHTRFCRNSHNGTNFAVVLDTAQFSGNLPAWISWQAIVWNLKHWVARVCENPAVWRSSYVLATLKCWGMD